jgi:hypothetical protein
VVIALFFSPSPFERHSVIVVALCLLQIGSQFRRQVNPNIVLIIGATSDCVIEENLLTSLAVDSATIGVAEGKNVTLCIPKISS